MRRRDFVILVGGAAVSPLPALADAASIRLGFLGTGSASASDMFVAALKDGLRENGMIEGRDYVFDFAWAEGRYERFPELATQMVQRKPTVILATTISAVRAAQRSAPPLLSRLL